MNNIDLKHIDGTNSFFWSDGLEYPLSVMSYGNRASGSNPPQTYYTKKQARQLYRFLKKSLGVK